MLTEIVFARISSSTNMKPPTAKGANLNENNWHSVMQHIDEFPMRTSEIACLNKDIKLSKVSFKYNLRGKETYFNGQKQVELFSGDYLLATNQSYCEVNIEQMAQNDLGICIDINELTFTEALNVHFQSMSSVYQHEIKRLFLSESFFLAYPAERFFKRYLESLYLSIKEDTILDLQEAEFEFLQHFVHQQTPYLIAYQQIPVLKNTTRKELYDKLLLAKKCLQDAMYSPISIRNVAQHICMSEYRFYHLFKAAFNISPNKYLHQLRMEQALTMFKTANFTWTEISSLLQYADLQSFSKAFKKQFKMSPSNYAQTLNSLLPVEHLKFHSNP